VLSEYPEHAWRPWAFDRSPRGWWKDLAAAFAKSDQIALFVVREFYNDISDQYGVANPNDWAKIIDSVSATEKYRFAYFGGLGPILRGLFPGDIPEQTQSTLSSGVLGKISHMWVL